jgi:hypothetical protein
MAPRPGERITRSRVPETKFFRSRDILDTNKLVVPNVRYRLRLAKRLTAL